MSLNSVWKTRVINALKPRSEIVVEEFNHWYIYKWTVCANGWDTTELFEGPITACALPVPVDTAATTNIIEWNVALEFSLIPSACRECSRLRTKFIGEYGAEVYVTGGKK